MGTESSQPQIKFSTSLGEFSVQLDGVRAPVTVKNFLTYVDAGFYDDTVFHRVISGFMIQGGGFGVGMRERVIGSLGLPMPPIENEAANGLKNRKYTIAMARTSDPNSATSQFFINVSDNTSLDYSEGKSPGYAVFGKVIGGEEVVEEISKVQTGSSSGHEDVPIEPVTLFSIRRLN